MDDKTEELRDIFIDVTEEETVTESQAEQRGSLLREESVEDRLAEVVDRMRDEFGFETPLDDDALCTVITEFYDGESDEGIATILNVPVAMVVQARMDLHLVRDVDTSGLDVEELRDRLDIGDTVDDVAADLEVSPGTVEQAARAIEAEQRSRRVSQRFRTAIEAEQRSRRVSQRFRTEFEEILTDADIAVQLTADVQDDGLDDATEGMEVDVEF